MVGSAVSLYYEKGFWKYFESIICFRELFFVYLASWKAVNTWFDINCIMYLQAQLVNRIQNLIILSISQVFFTLMSVISWLLYQMPNYLFPGEFQSKNSIISGACTFKTISATPSFLPLFLYFSVKTLANFYYGTLWETADSAFDMQESSADNCCFFTCSSLASSSKCQLKSFL